MQIRAVQDDGSSSDVTELVVHAYECLLEGTRLHRDWAAADVENFAELARVIGHGSAENVAEIAAGVRLEEDRERTDRIAWQRQRAQTVIDALTACG